MNGSRLQFLQFFFLLLDLLLLNVAFFIAAHFFAEGTQSQHFMRYVQFRLYMNAFWFLAGWIGEVYYQSTIAYFDRFIQKTMQIFVLWALLMVVYLYLPRLVSLSRGVVFTTIILFFFALLFNRFIYIVIRQFIKRKVGTGKKILIVGYNDLSKRLATYLDKETFGAKIVGYVDDNIAEDKTDNIPLYSNIAETIKISKQLRVNDVYCTIMPENNSKVYKIIQQADKELIRFRIVPDFNYLINKPVHIDYIRDLPVFSLRREPLELLINQFKKRAFDVIVSSLVAVFILSWLIPILGLLIKLESKGPIFFVQLRSGKNNKPFRCFKFRSMAENKEANSVQATKNDKRVTRIGRIIRKTSLDEFPQFLNVLVGEMSLVGPRPHMLKHTKQFSTLTDDYMIRQFLKPGITGWAQVNGYRGEITELQHIKKRVEYDLWYLEHWNLWLDVKIIFLTVYNVFKGEENAY